MSLRSCILKSVGKTFAVHKTVEVFSLKTSVVHDIIMETAIL